MRLARKSGVLTLLFVFAAAVAPAYEVNLKYFNIRNADLAESLHVMDEAYEERERSVKEARRDTPFDAPAYLELTEQLDRLREERDREILDRLEGNQPEIHYSSSLGSSETAQESTTANGNPLHIEFKLFEVEDGKIPLELSAEYDGRRLYQGSALLIPFDTPYLISKSSIKMGDKRQMNLIFVEIRR